MARKRRVQRPGVNRRDASSDQKQCKRSKPRKPHPSSILSTYNNSADSPIGQSAIHFPSSPAQQIPLGSGQFHIGESRRSSKPRRNLSSLCRP
jgi:hypothetical protein